jgi:hypothetical protein
MVTYDPALRKRDAMPKNDPQSTALNGSSHRRWLSAVLVTLVVAASAASALLISQVGNNPSSSPSEQMATSGTASTTPTVTTISAQIEIMSRLRKILQVRDRALLTRDADLLSGIYTIDCECLEDGRALIDQLHKKNIVWRGVKTEVSVTSTEEVNDRLWIVVATVKTPPVRIETERGRLIRIVPPERNRVRFALAKPRDKKEWLLGNASTFD